MGGICRAAAVALRTSRTTRHVRKSLHIFESRGKVRYVFRLQNSSLAWNYTEYSSSNGVLAPLAPLG